MVGEIEGIQKVSTLDSIRAETINRLAEYVTEAVTASMREYWCSREAVPETVSRSETGPSGYMAVIGLRSPYSQRETVAKICVESILNPPVSMDTVKAVLPGDKDPTIVRFNDIGRRIADSYSSF